jgi:hypothetical protein
MFNGGEDIKNPSLNIQNLPAGRQGSTFSI